MTPLYELPLRPDRKTIFSRMHIVPESPNYAVFLETYNQIVDSLPELVTPRGCFLLKPATAPGRIHKGLSEVSHLVYAMVTLGSTISEASTNAFGEKDFLKGLMLDTIADQLLFDAGDTLYPLIKKAIYDEQGYALTHRYSPGDGPISIEKQGLILEEVEGQKHLGVDITSGFMYNPPKTMGYIYGADKNIATAEKDHDCSLCGNLSCALRNLEA